MDGEIREMIVDFLLELRKINKGVLGNEAGAQIIKTAAVISEMSGIKWNFPRNVYSKRLVNSFAIGALNQAVEDNSASCMDDADDVKRLKTGFVADLKDSHKKYEEDA